MPVYKKYGFGKEERLCSRKEITRLFEEGNSFFSYPFNLIWIKSDNKLHFPAQFAISVSRKSFKKAVTRNRIKRLIREAWRLEKSVLYEYLKQHNICLIVMLIYIGNDVPRHAELRPKVVELIRNFSLHLDKSGRSKYSCI